MGDLEGLKPALTSRARRSTALAATALCWVIAARPSGPPSRGHSWQASGYHRAMWLACGMAHGAGVGMVRAGLMGEPLPPAIRRRGAGGCPRVGNPGTAARCLADGTYTQSAVTVTSRNQQLRPQLQRPGCSRHRLGLAWQ